MAKVPRKLTNHGASDGAIETGRPTPATVDPLSRTSSSSGSLRKVVPAVPDADQQFSMAGKMIDRRPSAKKGSNCFTPYFREYALLAEYNLLQTQSVPGVYAIPSGNSPFVWFGVIFVRQGLYREGIFRFSLHIPADFPNGDVPRVLFDSEVYHPSVDPETGEIDVMKGFPYPWRKDINHLWHILLYLRRIFYKIETSTPLNPEAAVLYESDPDMFKLKVEKCVSASKDRVYDAPKTSDPHAIIFSKYNPSLHDPVRDQLKKKDRQYVIPEGSSLGCSWIQPGTITPFSRPVS